MSGYASVDRTGVYAKPVLSHLGRDTRLDGSARQGRFADSSACDLHQHAGRCSVGPVLPTLPGADGRGLNRGPLFSEVLPDKIIKRLEKAGPLGQALLALRLAAPRTKLGRDSRGRGLDADDLLERGAIGGNKTKLSANPFAVAARAVTNSELSVAFGSVLLMSTSASPAQAGAASGGVRPL
jgi:hypothetical protein